MKSISFELSFQVEFYDVDSMGVVYHGNYPKYFDMARSHLLDKIGYGYKAMERDGFAFPVITMDIKYIKPLYFGDVATIKVCLVEFRDYLAFKYEVRNASGQITTKGSTKQVAVKWATMETQYESPATLVGLVEKYEEGC